MGTLYRLEPDSSRFIVQAFASGMLSFLGHSPTFAVRDFDGKLHWDPETPQGGELEVTVRADSLELTDKVRPADRQEIEGRMRREVLEVSTYPEIVLRSTEMITVPVADRRYRLRLVGGLELRGVTNRLAFDAELRLFDDGVRLAGEFPLHLSDYRIRPVTALGGTLRLRDELRVAFDVAVLRNDS
jgi:polyisoprenoid-binding protein YceI